MLAAVFEARATLHLMGKKADRTTQPPLPLRLRDARKRRGWSQEDLGERLGVTGVTIGRIEKGKQNWNQEFLQDAAGVLGCHWTDLLPADPSSVLWLWSRIPDEERGRAWKALMLFVIGDQADTKVA